MLFPSGSFGLHCYTLELATLKLFTGGFRAPSVEAAKAPAKALEWGLPSSRMALLRTSKERYAEAMLNEGDISREVAIDPLVANARNFYKVEKWTRDGTKVDGLLYAGNNLGRARWVFERAIKHRPRMHVTIRQQTRVLDQYPPRPSEPMASRWR